MTYEERYQITGKKKEWFCLYEARKVLREMAEAGTLTDATIVKRQGRHVAYFNEWTETVRPMWEANEQERYVLLAWENDQKRPFCLEV